MSVRAFGAVRRGGFLGAATGPVHVSFALLLLVPTNASGEQATVDAAREHFLRGVELFQEGENDAALADFERAYELAPHWGVLYNVGRLQSELRRYPEAVATLGRYLREGGREISDERRREVTAELRRLHGLVGRLAVEVSRPSGAAVYVDGVEAGRAPLAEPLPVSAGRRTVEVRAEGFMTFRREVTVPAGTTRRVAVALEAAAATAGAIFLSVAVPGATVTLDGEEVGTTPLEAPIRASPGRHVVEVSRPGYETVGRTVEVVAGDLVTLEVALRQAAELPRELAASLALDVSERDAEVRVDGVVHEGGPLPAGPHLVTVEAPGFHEWAREVELEAGSPLRLRAELLPTPSFLTRYARRARAWQIGGWITLAAGVAITGAFAGLETWVLRRHEDWRAVRAELDAEYALPEEDPRRVHTPDQLEALYEEHANRLDRLNIEHGLYIGGICLGGAAVVAGIVLLAVAPRVDRYARVSLAPTPGGLSASLTLALP